MRKSLSIGGMTCNHCKSHVMEALRKVTGVKSATVDLANKKAVIESDSPVSDEALKAAVAVAGYTVTGISEN